MKKEYLLEGYKKYLRLIPIYAFMSLALTVFGVILMIKNTSVWWIGLIVVGLGLLLLCFLYFLKKYTKKKIKILEKEIDEVVL